MQAIRATLAAVPPRVDLLVLAKHAVPAVDANVPASEWHLSADGVDGARRLGEQLRAIAPDVVVSSVERKALQTGSIAAEVLDVTFHTAADLHEHVRPFVARERFEAEMERFFARPQVKVFGDESAAEAESRFTRGLDAVVRAHGSDRLAVVAHGTVLSLHLAARYGLDAYATWSRLGLPAYVVVERRTKSIVDLVDAV